MSFDVIKPVLQVCRVHRYLQRITFWTSVWAFVLLAALFHPAFESRPLLPVGGLLLIYGLRKTYLFFQTRRALRQSRLEVQFLRQRWEPRALQQCLYRTDHFWHQSLILRALRSILAHPLPAQLAEPEVKRRLQRSFRKALRPLRLPQLNLDGVLYLAALGTWLALHEPGQTSIWQYGLIAGATTLVGVLEALQAHRQWLLRSHNRAMRDALCQWVRAKRFHAALRTIEQPEYTHSILYQARPWFNGTRRAAANDEGPASFPINPS